MFYSQFILAKKGPLATIWIAAHLERKLRKNQITETDIGDSVDSILYPEVPIALRLSGHLLLGVVRIYSRKVNLLFHDCSEALDKIRQAFQISAVDLPPGSVVAPYHSITLPDSFDFDDLEAHLGRENAAAEARTRNEFEHHVTARDLITLQDQNEDHQYFFNLDERFAGEGNPYAVLDLSIEDLNSSRKSDAPNAVSLSPEVAPHVAEEDVLPPFPMEEDMEFEGMDQDRVPASPKFDVKENANKDAGDGMDPEAGALEARLHSNLDALLEVPEIEKLRSAYEANNQDHVMGLGDLDMEKEASATTDPHDGYRSIRKNNEIAHIFDETPVLREEPTPFGPQTSSPVRSLGDGVFEDNDILGSILRGRTPKLDVVPTPVVEKRGGRKRKRVLDATLVISSAEMKKQLKTTNDICRVRKKAPSTEYEIWMSRRVNHMEQKFLSPSAPGMPDELKDQFACMLNRVLKTPGRDTRSSRGLLKSQVKEAGGKFNNAIEKADKPIEIIGADTIDHDVGLQKPENGVAVPDDETVAHGLEIGHDMPDQMDQPASSSVEKAVEHVDDAYSRELSSPISDKLADHADGGAIDVLEDPSNEAVENQLKGGPNEEPLMQCAAVVEERQTSNDGISNVDAVAPQSDTSEGLGFLGDSRETDEAAYDVGSTDELGGSTLEDNSGWSSRTRAVAQYLKDRFEASERGSNRKQGKEQEAHKLSLESLLKGRKRKEAARMFFETLVLGSKGYLQVEQDAVYADIYLGSSQRLMKAVF